MITFSKVAGFLEMWVNYDYFLKNYKNFYKSLNFHIFNSFKIINMQISIVLTSSDKIWRPWKIYFISNKSHFLQISPYERGWTGGCICNEFLSRYNINTNSSWFISLTYIQGTIELIFRLSSEQSAERGSPSWTSESVSSSRALIIDFVAV